MNIKGKITLFVEKKVRDDQSTFNVFSGTISHKNEDGTYTNASIEIKFDKAAFTLEQLNALEEKYAYALNVEDGFISCRGYTDKNGNAQRRIYLQVLKGNLTDKKEIKNDITVHCLPKDKLPF